MPPLHPLKHDNHRIESQVMMAVNHSKITRRVESILTTEIPKRFARKTIMGNACPIFITQFARRMEIGRSNNDATMRIVDNSNRDGYRFNCAWPER